MGFPFFNDIDRLGRVQRQAARFISRDCSYVTGYITRMLQDLGLPSLKEKKNKIRLSFLYTVVGGLVPAMRCHKYWTPSRGKRWGKPYGWHTVSLPKPGQSSLYKNSFFPQTVIDWNQQPNEVVWVETRASTRRTRIRALSLVAHICMPIIRRCDVTIQIQNHLWTVSNAFI